MATGPPTGGPPPTQLLEQTPPPSPTSWDGDRMFNIYIYDYCIKRGYANTARELTREADIPQDSSPPINAKQGLLFEWWSVFWVLFTAKSSGNGPEDALLYTQHQAQQTQRQPPRQGAQPGPPRYIGPVNGARPGMPPTQMPNGVVSATAQPSQPPMTNGAQSGSFGPGPQPNGIVGPSHPAGPSIGTPAMMPGQRPGVAPPQRAPNGAPFQSPTMAHSPHHPGHPGQQPPMNASLGPQGSMQMRGAMPPPGPPQGLMGNPQQPPPGFQPLAGASNSHPNSPAAHGVSQSPSFANRQPQLQGQIRSQNPDATVNTEFMRIEAVRLNQLKDELGLGGVDVPSLSSQDKARIVALAKERGAIRDQIPKPGAPQNGPDGQPNRMQQPLQPGQQRPLGAPFAQQGQNQQRIKRNSTSPGDETEQGQNESSPPANKRPRTSPTGAEPQPPMAGLGFPPQPPMHPGPGGPQHPPNAMTPLLPGGGSFASGQRMGNPSMGGMPAPILQYRQNMTALHRSGIPGGGPNMMPTNAPSPANPESPFPPPGDGSQSRPGTSQFPGNRPQQQQQNKPPGMMPPPSPGLKKEDTGSGIQSVHSSPHNLPAVTGGHGAHQPPQQGPGTAPPTPAQNNATITAPSPSAGMNNQQAPGGQGQPGPQGGNQPPVQQSSAPPGNNASNDLFMTQDFMQQLGGIGGFESFDSSSLFPGDQMGGGGELDFDSMINFENPNLWGGFS